MNAPADTSISVGISSETMQMNKLCIVLGALVLNVWIQIPTAVALPLTTALKTEATEDPYANDGKSFRVLCYHDARDNLRASFDAWPERSALATYELIDQFEWLRENGYHVVNIDQILAARSGGPPLPAKAVLITIDDGYLSTYTRIFPLLKLFHYPAVIGLVGEWMNATRGMVYYGDRWIPRDAFVTWEQVREMTASTLVEVASHSHDLHKGIQSNPQGSLTPAAVTRRYDATLSRYESDAEYQQRIRADLARNSALIARHTGHRPRVMIWPYGAYNILAIDAARAEGMPITMTLDAGPNISGHSLGRVRRDMLFFHDKVSDLKANLRQPAQFDGVERPLSRIIAVDLNQVYATDATVREQRIDNLVEQLKRLHVNHVYLRAWFDPDHDGAADALYFPNRHLPVRADFFNRVAWQIRTRAVTAPESIYVHAWLPVHGLDRATAETSTRGTPAQRRTFEIYEDLAKNGPRLGGIVFDDDAPDDRLKDRLPLLQRLRSAFQVYHPAAFTTLYLHTNAASVPRRWARHMVAALSSFDFVATGFQGGTRSTEQLADFVEAAAVVPNAIDRTAFLLIDQDVTGQHKFVNMATGDRLRILQRLGARNFGVVLGGSLDDRNLRDLFSSLSLETNPGSIQ